MDHDLLPLDEATARLRPSGRHSFGVRPIWVGQIVGTDSRGSDFDRDFSARRRDVRERVRTAERIHAEQERIFMAESGLGDACPDSSCLRFTRAVGYRR